MGRKQKPAIRATILAVKNRQPPPLTFKTLKFIDEYVESRNALQSAVAAGYSAATAGARGSQLLTDERVQRAIVARTEQIELAIKTRTAITKTDVVQWAVAGMRGSAADKQWAAHRGHVELIGKLHGYIVERRDVRIIASVRDLSDEELGRLLIEGEVIDEK